MYHSSSDLCTLLLQLTPFGKSTISRPIASSVLQISWRKHCPNLQIIWPKMYFLISIKVYHQHRFAKHTRCYHHRASSKPTITVYWIPPLKTLKGFVYCHSKQHHLASSTTSSTKNQTPMTILFTIGSQAMSSLASFCLIYTPIAIGLLLRNYGWKSKPQKIHHLVNLKNLLPVIN